MPARELRLWPEWGHVASRAVLALPVELGDWLLVVGCRDCAWAVMCWFVRAFISLGVVGWVRPAVPRFHWVACWVLGFA